MPAVGLYEVLEGIEAELELERELGVRSVEIDRTLLEGMGSNRAELGSNRIEIESGRVAEAPLPSPASGLAPTPPPRNSSTPPLSQGLFDFAFLHHRMLSPGGIAMMAKIVTAMKKTPDTAPIVFEGERPKARVYVVLGGLAMRKWFPELRCAAGQWAKGPRGEEVLVTYSPEFILRDGLDESAVKKLKVSMWTSLKGVMQRIGQTA